MSARIDADAIEWIKSVNAGSQRQLVCRNRRRRYLVWLLCLHGCWALLWAQGIFDHRKWSEIDRDIAFWAVCIDEALATYWCDQLHEADWTIAKGCITNTTKVQVKFGCNVALFGWFLMDFINISTDIGSIGQGDWLTGCGSAYNVQKTVYERWCHFRHVCLSYRYLTGRLISVSWSGRVRDKISKNEVFEQDNGFHMTCKLALLCMEGL